MLNEYFRSTDRTKANAKNLRSNQTTPERMLWKRLRRRGLGCKFRRQVALGPYIVDFLNVEKKVIIELDGTSHDGISSQLHDMHRDEYFRMKGYKTIRISNEDVRNALDSVVERLRGELADASLDPTP